VSKHNDRVAKSTHREEERRDEIRTGLKTKKSSEEKNAGPKASTVKNVTGGTTNCFSGTWVA